MFFECLSSETQMFMSVQTQNIQIFKLDKTCSCTPEDNSLCPGFSFFSSSRPMVEDQRLFLEAVYKILSCKRSVFSRRNAHLSIRNKCFFFEPSACQLNRKAGSDQICIICQPNLLQNTVSILLLELFYLLMVKITFAILERYKICMYLCGYTHTKTQTHTQANIQPKLKTKQSIKSPLHYHGNKSALYILFLQSLDQVVGQSLKKGKTEARMDNLVRPIPTTFFSFQMS